MNAIEMINLRKEFKDQVAVSNLNIQVKKGMFFGFLGPNGAGKTTTIKMMVGLLKPSSGKVKILGYDVGKKENEFMRKIGIVLDKPLYFEKLTAKEHLLFVGKMYGLSKETVNERTEELLEYFEIQDIKDKWIETYSAGMKRKISLAAALIHDPDLLILDEPFESIDTVASKAIRNNMNLLVKKGATIFMTSHNLEIVENLCSDIAIINKGELIFLNSAKKIREEIEQKRYSNLEELFIKLLTTGKEKESLSWLE